MSPNDGETIPGTGPSSSEAERRRIREAAIRLLAVRARSAKELDRRLNRKGFPAEQVERVVADLQAKGYQSDESFAKQYAEEKRTRSGWAPARVRRELRARGITAGLIDKVVTETYQEHDLAAEVLPKALRRWRSSKGLSLEARRRRLTGYLQRRGYDWETIRSVLKSTEQTE